MKSFQNVRFSRKLQLRLYCQAVSEIKLNVDTRLEFNSHPYVMILFVSFWSLCLASKMKQIIVNVCKKSVLCRLISDVILKGLEFSLQLKLLICVMAQLELRRRKSCIVWNLDQDQLILKSFLKQGFSKLWWLSANSGSQYVIEGCKGTFMNFLQDLWLFS